MSAATNILFPLIASPHRQTLNVWALQRISNPLPITKRNPKFPLTMRGDSSQQDVTGLSPCRINGYPETSERPARLVATSVGDTAFYSGAVCAQAGVFFSFFQRCLNGLISCVIFAQLQYDSADIGGDGTQNCLEFWLGAIARCFVVVNWMPTLPWEY